MTSTGRKERVAEIEDNIRRRAQINNNTIIDEEQLEQIRRDHAKALEDIALHFQGRIDRLEAIITAIGKAADDHIKRTQT